MARIHAYFHSNQQSYFDDADDNGAYSKVDVVIFHSCTITGYTQSPDSVTLTVYHSGVYVSDLVTRVHNDGGLVLMSILESGSNAVCASDAGLRAELVSEIDSLITTYNLDGFDIDFEWSGMDKDLTSQLIIDLKAAITPKLVTCAVSGDQTHVDFGCNGSLDYIHVMAYDLWHDHSGSGGPDNDYPEHASMEGMQWAVELYTTEGFNKNKILAGIPFYGRDGGSSYWYYRDIYNAITPPPSQNTHSPSSPWLGQSVTDYIWWNGPDYIKEKVEWLKNNSWCGAMIYQLGEDKYDANSLLNVIYDEFNAVPPPVYTLYESFNTYDDNDNFLGIYWKAQTFTPATTHRIKQVKLFNYRASGSPSGNLDIAIKAVDGASKPTGAALCSGSIPISDIATDPGGVYTIDLGTGAILSNGTEYAIVFSAPSESINIYYYGNVAGGYAGGVLWASGDSGATWAPEGDLDDAYFEEWGLSAPLPADKLIGGSGVLIGTSSKLIGVP